MTFLPWIARVFTKIVVSTRYVPRKKPLTWTEHNRKGSGKNNINKWCPPTCSIILALAVWRFIVLQEIMGFYIGVVPILVNEMPFVRCIFLVSYFRRIHTSNLQVLICILIIFVDFQYLNIFQIKRDCKSLILNLACNATTACNY